MNSGDTNIPWESLLVERPFCQQLKAMGWTWLEGDTVDPTRTERQSFREVLLKSRLAAAVHRINRIPGGMPWLDDARIEKAIRQLEATGGMRLMEANRHVTELLLKGTVTEGLPGWDGGRPQPLRFIDFDHPENNDFLVINQFKVELTRGQGHIVADVVLFVNGLPLGLGELKNPAVDGPLEQAIDQLLRYSNQRQTLYPDRYREHEGVERLFHANQLLIASDFFEARVGAVGAPPEAYLEWADTGPAPMSQVAAEVGRLARAAGADAAEQETAEARRALGAEQAGRAGTPLFFRPDPKATKPLSSQQMLVAGMLRPAHLLDIVQNFILFQAEDGKTRKVVARYQQFRAVHRMIGRLLLGAVPTHDAERDLRGGIIWHTQGSGKSLTMVFLVRKMRSVAALSGYKIVVVTDRTDLERQLRDTARLTGETVRPSKEDKQRRETATARTQRILAEDSPDLVFAMIQKYQDTEARRTAERVRLSVERREIRVLEAPGAESPIRQTGSREVILEETLPFQGFPELNRSERILVLVDEAHRGQSQLLHRNLRKALPNAAIIGFTGTPILAKEKTETRAIFGDFIDRYLLRDAEQDGATVPIRYEGRTADGLVKDADSLDTLFEDMFRGYTPRELAQIKAKYATQGDVLEAPMLIEKKAADMLEHYVAGILPEGFKGQVVASSRAAAVTYYEKLSLARDRLVAELEALPPERLAADEDFLETLSRRERFLIAAHPHLAMIRALEFAVVVSGFHNDPEHWKNWTTKENQEAHIQRFKRPLGPQRTEKSDPLGLLIVTNMLLTGFDAPVEQVLYLDRRIIAHELLQAIARVNRTHGGKRYGLVVDYIGVARHLNEALGEYDREDIAGSDLDIHSELPKLRDRHARVMGIFTSRGLTDLLHQVQEAVERLADLKIRADFINKLRLFYETLGLLEHRPEVPPEMFRDAKLLGFINKAAANLYRDPALNLLGVAAKVRALIDRHVTARGVDSKIEPIAITDIDFARAIGAKDTPRTRALKMQHEARYHITRFENRNPGYARKMSERLEEILKAFKDDWDAQEKALRTYMDDLQAGDVNEFPDLSPESETPFVRLVLDITQRQPCSTLHAGRS